MKQVLVLIILIFAFLPEAYAATTKKTKKVKAEVRPVKKEEAPCETKEDILKKLEEEKKKLKPFSLQGGNTGCSVNEKK